MGIVCDAEDLDCFLAALDSLPALLPPAAEIVQFARDHYSPIAELTGMLNETMFLLKSQPGALSGAREDLR